MAKDKGKGSNRHSKAEEDLDDEFETDDGDALHDVIELIGHSDKLATTRRRVENYFEEKRLRELMGDDYL
ncbi:MAG: hypothetical protein J4A00_03270 [Gammaproteobacteria bacterium]|nr:hypothetical protein [Gammaproteobacteria bacterium]